MGTSRTRARPKVGLVLSGGGARGAYEVGVIRYIREKLGKRAQFDVITGTSVGAINGAYLAATADRPRAQGRMLQRVWLEELSVDRLYGFGWNQLRALPTVLFGRSLPKTPHGGRVGGLIDSRYIEHLVRTRIPWRGITENLHRGVLSAVACTATEVATGITTVFVQMKGRYFSRPWPDDPYEEVVRTSISTAHTLASAAIPTLFPSVRVGDQFFVDGALRQNTPLRPAMRLGADRLVVIGLRRREPPVQRIRRMREHASAIYPNAFFLFGKMLDALMLDKIDVDLGRIQRINHMLEAGEREFGSDFADRLGEAMGKPPYARVNTLLISPSENLGQVAYDVVRRTGLSHYKGLMARLIRNSIAADENAMHEGESDLASWLLFDPHYSRRLIELGWADAERQRDELLALLCE